MQRQQWTSFPHHVALLWLYWLISANRVYGCSFFVSNFNATAMADGKTLARANYYNRFRGPDATNIEYVHGWTFLHNLLSMTGTFTLQPFVDTDNDVAVLFNGEVYNYRSLAKELEGDEDAFKSDGFSLLPAYRRWGDQFVEHLHGEFAIVLVDFRKAQVIVSTDVFSTKPLWYGVWQCGKARPACFAAASYESVLTGVGVPAEERKMADPNKVLILSFRQDDHFKVQSQKPMFQFDLTQHKTSTLDWEKAFMQAMRVRTDRIKHKMFIGLSSGFDSGAIMLALELLKKPFFAYNVATDKDSNHVIQERADYCKFSQSEFIQLSQAEFAKQESWLLNRIEKFKYVHFLDRPVTEIQEMYSYEDKASIGLSALLSKVRDRGGLIYLSGSGADETISDYGMDGQKIYPHSCFAGVFPEDLKEIFPWCSFYLGTQRSYLMKEELTGGAHGIESRYPFLDPHVVQEYLWLTADLKNSEYKRPVADFLRKHDFPNLYGVKAGFGVTQSGGTKGKEESTVEGADVRPWTQSPKFATVFILAILISAMVMRYSKVLQRLIRKVKR